jgi:hypothetical protein
MTAVDLDRGGALSRACKLSGSRLRLNADIKLSKPHLVRWRNRLFDHGAPTDPPSGARVRKGRRGKISGFGDRHLGGSSGSELSRDIETTSLALIEYVALVLVLASVASGLLLVCTLRLSTFGSAVDLDCESCDRLRVG